MRKAERADLPDNLSDLLELSVYDAMACEEDPKYVLNMASWVKTNGACQVCMAGAVMVKTRGINRAVSWLYTLSGTEAANVSRYSAIDSMRKGYFFDAARDLGIHMDESVSDLAAAKLRSEEFRVGRFPERGKHHYPWKEYLAAAAVLRDNGY